MNQTPACSPIATDAPTGEVGMKSAKRLSLKSNFAWALGANLIFNLSQWLILVLLTKLFSADKVGEYSLAVAICTPLTTLASLKLGVIQVTDKKGEFSVGDFLGVQIVLSAISMLLISIAAFTSEDATAITTLVLLVGLGQAITLIRDVFLSLNQKWERMDTVAISKAITAAATLIVFSAVVFATKSLVLGAAAMLACRMLVFVMWDIPQTRFLVSGQKQSESREGNLESFFPKFDTRLMLRIFLLGLPMGLASFIQALYINLPKLYLSHFLGTAALAYFTAILAVSMLGKLVIQAATASVLPRLTQYYERDQPAFNRLLGKLVLFGAGMGIAGVVFSVAFGELLLSLAFTPEYAAYSSTFTLTMVFVGIAYIGTFLTYANAAMGNYKIQPVSNFAGLAVVTAVAPFLIQSLEINGAACSLIAAVTLQTVILAISAFVGTRKRTSTEELIDEETRAVESLRVTE